MKMNKLRDWMSEQSEIIRHKFKKSILLFFIGLETIIIWNEKFSNFRKKAPSLSQYEMFILSGLGSQTNKLQNLKDTYQSSYIHHIWFKILWSKRPIVLWITCAEENRISNSETKTQ